MVSKNHENHLTLHEMPNSYGPVKMLFVFKRLDFNMEHKIGLTNNAMQLA